MAALTRRVVVFLGLIAAALAGPQAAVSQSLISEPRYAAVMIDAASGEVLFSSRADSPRYPASITKVMTLYLAFEAMAAGRLSPSDLIRISPRAAAQPPSKLGLRAGSTIRVDEAINALAIKSANDVAVAMAEHIGGTESRFAALMTLRAQELGMRGTRYVNASGLPDSRQITSARDLAVLSRAVMRDYPQYYSTFSTRSFSHRGVAMNNHNRLLFQMAGVDGIKTGFTNASGYNLAASAVRGGRRLIAVVLGGPSGRARDSHTRHLLETGFSLMARRDAGERIQFAANLFEQQPAGYAVRGSVEQGSQGAELDADGLGQPPVRVGGGRSQLAMVTPSTQPFRALARSAVTASATMAPVADPVRPRPAPVVAAPAPTPTPARTAAREEARPAAATPTRSTRRAAADTGGDWIVQVGAFGSEGDARARIGEVVRRFDRHFDASDGSVARASSQAWRVRFAGYSEPAARAACAALSARREPCMVVAGT